MEGLFIFPGLVEAGQSGRSISFPQEGESSLKSGGINIDFDQLLKDSVKKVEEGLWDTTLSSMRSCGPCGSEGGTQTVNPCSFASAPVATRLSCSSSNCAPVSLSSCSSPESFASGFDLTSVREGIGQFLENLEAINLSLDLGGKGVVQIQGARNENGEFTFQIQGSKDALTELFTALFGYLATMVQGEGGIPNTSQSCSFACNQDSMLPCGNSTSTSLTSIVSPCGSSIGTTVEVSENSGEIADGEEPEANVETEIPLVTVATEEEEGTIPVIGEDFSPDITQAEPVADEIPETGDDSLAMASGDGEAVQNRKETRDKTSDVMDGFTSLEDGTNTPRMTSVSPESNVISVPNLTDTNQVEKIFDNILRFVSRENGSKEVVIKLQPESLGSIVVRLKEDTGHLQCVWEIADARTRELIQRSLPLLETRLQEQGFTFANFWSGSAQEQFNWQRSSGWVLGSLSDVVGEIAEEDTPAFTADYRVNLLA
ncbi:MAG: flagellar hook-length control protein FliK [Candidatus Atribacteria bacterium]|nr:flagellar hook-length control protein FliK [Candidatus Atribacteria bacterium]